MHSRNVHPLGANLRLIAILLSVAFLCPDSTVFAGDPPVSEAAAPERLVAERTSLASGAEILTIFGRSGSGANAPIVAILTDTLGDDDTANDQLRYVWVFTYCPPSLRQKVLASIPFYYARASTRIPEAGKTPPVVHDFSRYRRSAWKNLAFYGAQLALIDPAGLLFRAGTRTYLRNEDAYRGAHLENALSVIEAFRQYAGETEFRNPTTEASLGQLVMRGKVGAFLNEAHLSTAARAHSSKSRKNLARNWELLRQRAEEEGLVFEPISSTSSSASHAIVWVSADEVARSPRKRAFNARFLNIASPWSDEQLRHWEGYTRRFHVESTGRYATEPSPGSTPVDMIPLGVYGLDFPRIPALLVDFRSFFNPKSREISGRAIDDVGQYILDATPFGDAKFFLLKRFWGTFSRRKGIDISQPTRATAYAQLATLVALEEALDPELNDIVNRALGRLRTNPLQSRWDSEREAALAQYEALMSAAKSGEIDRRVERDRASERVRLEHGLLGRALRKLATIGSFGLYRPKGDSPETREKYALSRSMRTHAALIAEVAATPHPIDVVWAPEKYRQALDFVAAHGELAPAALAVALGTIVRSTSDIETQIVALEALARMNNGAAHEQLAKFGSAVDSGDVVVPSPGSVAPGGLARPEWLEPSPTAP